MPSLKHARLVLSLTIPANFLIRNPFICNNFKYLFFQIELMMAYIGFLMVAFFDGCDPLALGELQSIDQMTILMANRIFGSPQLFHSILIVFFPRGCPRIAWPIFGHNFLGHPQHCQQWNKFIDCRPLGGFYQGRTVGKATFRFGHCPIDEITHRMPFYSFSINFPNFRFPSVFWPRQWHLPAQIWAAFFTLF
jgi:hypothetical protein